MEYWGQRWEQETSSLVRRPSWWRLGLGWCQWKLTEADGFKTYFGNRTNRAYKWMDGRVWVRERNQGWPLDWKKLWIRNCLQLLLQCFMICLEFFNFTDFQGEMWGGQKVTTQWFFYNERYGGLGLRPCISSRGQLCASFSWEGIWTRGLWLLQVVLQQTHPVSCLWNEIFRDITTTCFLVAAKKLLTHAINTNSWSRKLTKF